MSSINLKAFIGNAARTGALSRRPCKGSSFYKLPRVLQWFSGNIGFHHIHHFSPRIPNYNLEKCHKADPLFQTGQAHHVVFQLEIAHLPALG